MGKYSLLKGKVRYLKISKEKEEKYKNPEESGFIESILGLFIIEMIGGFILITVAICKFVYEFVLSLLTFGLLQTKLLKGTPFVCYIGNVKVKGKLENVAFNNGDYVEMVVKKIDKNTYQAYAVRFPKYHALFFPKGVGLSTLQLLKYCMFGVGSIILCTDILIFISILFNHEWGSSEVIEITTTSCIGFVAFVFFFFFVFGGRSTFICNRIYATLGYPKPWLHNSWYEEFLFFKMNRRRDPELFDDPQTPEFQKIRNKDIQHSANYYCRTPIIPSWVNIIDESKYDVQITNHLK
ncbi:hypothetical protein [Gilliamella intestini]|uniref:Uncharacterized protein n=1 Tax=Gilliamella intestini TaxID=1798183 RepID=A0A1C4BAC2_9GAMM|nr:hypothetical protein [Gilliamella intestini]SCC03734.1 hypothetical protein GA0061080_101824 [Gilliamella intestini]